MADPRVLILMGSPNDWKVMEAAGTALDELQVPWEAHVSSAHRSPERTAKLVSEARDRGIRTVICGAGLAAHLAGVAASKTTLPIIAVPIAGGALQGLDALLASVQMPPGVPVATVAVDGARNAGLLAAQILGTFDDAVAERLAEAKRKMAEKVGQADADLQTKISG